MYQITLDINCNKFVYSHVESFLLNSKKNKNEIKNYKNKSFYTKYFNILGDSKSNRIFQKKKNSNKTHICACIISHESLLS